MAATLFKWLVPLLFIGSHPIHLSTTEINHNAKEKTLEISCRIFTDDFETALTNQFKTKVDLTDEKLQTAMDSLVAKYIRNRVQLWADEKPVHYTYLGFEIDSDAVFVYLEANNIISVKQIRVNNSILHDLYTDQGNILHVKVGGERKSRKLDYPDKQALFNF
jgi:hypothetical protein